MVENIIYALPEIILLCGIFVLFIMNLFNSQHRKTIKTCIIFMLLSAFMEVIFYNKSFSIHYLNDTAFNTLSNMIVYISSFAVLILAKRWYISENESPFIFCEALLSTLFFSNLLSASIHFAVTVIAYWGFIFINFLLLKHSHKLKENYTGLKNYKKAAYLFGSIMLLIAFVLYIENGHLAYSSLSPFVSIYLSPSEVSYLVFAIFICFAFLFGIAPLNFWRTEGLGQVILPVLAYFLLVPVAAYFGALLNLSIKIFSSQFASISNLTICFGTISLLIGAFGVCSGKNLYKLLAYGSLFHFGVILLSLSTINVKSIDNFVLYLIIYSVTTYGLISALFGLKSRGDYLLMLPDIAGAADKKPYISAMITIYLFSLIGLPPFLGFIGLYAVGYGLALNNHLYVLLFLLMTDIIITYGYMQIVKNLYFEKSKNIFDTTEREIYTTIIITAIFMAILIFNPDILIENLQLLTENFID